MTADQPLRVEQPIDYSSLEAVDALIKQPLGSDASVPELLSLHAQLSKAVPLHLENMKVIGQQLQQAAKARTDADAARDRRRRENERAREAMDRGITSLVAVETETSCRIEDLTDKIGQLEVVLQGQTQALGTTQACLQSLTERQLHGPRAAMLHARSDVLTAAAAETTRDLDALRVEHASAIKCHKKAHKGHLAATQLRAAVSAKVEARTAKLERRAQHTAQVEQELETMLDQVTEFNQRLERYLTELSFALELARVRDAGLARPPSQDHRTQLDSTFRRQQLALESVHAASSLGSLSAQIALDTNRVNRSRPSSQASSRPGSSRPGTHGGDRPGTSGRPSNLWSASSKRTTSPAAPGRSRPRVRARPRSRSHSRSSAVSSTTAEVHHPTLLAAAAFQLALPDDPIRGNNAAAAGLLAVDWGRRNQKSSPEPPSIPPTRESARRPEPTIESFRTAEMRSHLCRVLTWHRSDPGKRGLAARKALLRIHFIDQVVQKRVTQAFHQRQQLRAAIRNALGDLSVAELRQRVKCDDGQDSAGDARGQEKKHEGLLDEATELLMQQKYPSIAQEALESGAEEWLPDDEILALVVDFPEIMVTPHDARYWINDKVARGCIAEADVVNWVPPTLAGLDCKHGQGDERRLHEPTRDAPPRQARSEAKYRTIGKPSAPADSHKAARQKEQAHNGGAWGWDWDTSPCGGLASPVKPHKTAAERAKGPRIEQKRFEHRFLDKPQAPAFRACA